MGRAPPDRFAAWWHSARVRLGVCTLTARSSVCGEDVRPTLPWTPTRLERNSTATVRRRPGSGLAGGGGGQQMKISSPRWWPTAAHGTVSPGHATLQAANRSAMTRTVHSPPSADTAAQHPVAIAGRLLGRYGLGAAVRWLAALKYTSHEA